MTDLTPLVAADIGEVMRIERMPGYGDFVHGWTAEAHADELASPDARYFGFREGAALAGFVILQRVREPAIRLRRIAVAEPDRGTGTRLLGAVTDWVFETMPARAMRLDVALANPRGRRVYQREGWVAEGQDHEHLNLRLTREQWAAARGSG